LQNPHIFNIAIFSASGEHSQVLSIVKHQRRKRSNTWKGRLMSKSSTSTEFHRFNMSLLVRTEML